MLLYLFRKDVHIFRYIYLKFGSTEVLSAYDYECEGGKKLFKVQLFNKKVVEFYR